METICLKALSKVNLGLDVVRRLPNGYHEVCMIMQTLDLCDKLTLTITEEPGIYISANLDNVPLNEDNLIYKAGKLLMDEFGVQQGVSVYLEKNIPMAAGMAGGSTDAAAMMVGVNELFSLGLTRQELMERGVKIGADVPYCIMQGTALAEGIGEKLSRLAPLVNCPILIAKPDIDVSTKFVYTNLKLDENTLHPQIREQIRAIEKGNLQEIAALMGNVLETVTVPAYPVINEIKAHMMEHGAVGAMMSGSGPTVFGLFADEETAAKAYEAMKESGLAKQVHLTHPVNV